MLLRCDCIGRSMVFFDLLAVSLVLFYGWLARWWFFILIRR
jgi:hypothetical protein